MRGRERPRPATGRGIVNVLQFTLEGRTVYEGVPAFLVWFVPKSDAKPMTREGHTAVNFHGRISIGEATSEVMQVEATSIADISFGYGLVAGLGKGAQPRSQTPGGGRLLESPPGLPISRRGHALMFGPSLDFDSSSFDYRRLPGDSATPFLDSRVRRRSSRSPQ